MQGDTAVTNVLYLHGFASSPASRKIELLRPLLSPHGIQLVTPDLNRPDFERLEWELVVGEACRSFGEGKFRAIAGSSLGALVALETLRRVSPAVPLVMIAPALKAQKRWRERTPPGDPVVVYNSARDANVPIHRKFFEQMMHLSIDDEPPPSRVTIVMGTEDETVPFGDVFSTWERWKESGRLIPGSRLVEVAGGDHGLTDHVGVIAAAIIGAVAANDG